MNEIFSISITVTIRKYFIDINFSNINNVYYNKKIYVWNVFLIYKVSIFPFQLILWLCNDAKNIIKNMKHIKLKYIAIYKSFVSIGFSILQYE